jgi:tRNA pseudouridine55 synthase
VIHHIAKTYEGVVRFGFATDTYDADGEPSCTAQSVNLQLRQVADLAARFRAVIEQMPPPFSAKKVHGVPAYKLARKKKEVDLRSVQVEIKEFEILSVEGDRASFRARVSSGTYMRSVAHEMGQQLGCGAHLETLRRTAVAEFNLSDAPSVEQEAAQSGSLEETFVHPRRLLPNFPAVTADEENAARIHTGRAVNLPELSQARIVKVFRAQKELIAIATRVAGTLFHPSIVFSSEVRSAARIVVPQGPTRPREQPV